MESDDNGLLIITNVRNRFQLAKVPVILQSDIKIKTNIQCKHGKTRER